MVAIDFSRAVGHVTDSLIRTPAMMALAACFAVSTLASHCCKILRVHWSGS